MTNLLLEAAAGIAPPALLSPPCSPFCLVRRDTTPTIGLSPQLPMFSLQWEGPRCTCDSAVNGCPFQHPPSLARSSCSIQANSRDTSTLQHCPSNNSLHPWALTACAARRARPPCPPQHSPSCSSWAGTAAGSNGREPGCPSGPAYQHAAAANTCCPFP